MGHTGGGRHELAGTCVNRARAGYGLPPEWLLVHTVMADGYPSQTKSRDGQVPERTVAKKTVGRWPTDAMRTSALGVAGVPRGKPHGFPAAASRTSQTLLGHCGERLRGRRRQPDRVRLLTGHRRLLQIF